MKLISVDKITAALPEPQRSLKIYYYNQTDSTNNVAKKIIAEKEESPFVVLAESQTAGRGRLGRDFYSPSSTGIYMSIGLGGFSSPADAIFLTPAAAVAVTDAIVSLTGKITEIKWVNDIYFKDRKVCGILAESVFVERKFAAIVGIGLNMTTQNFPPELKGVAGSLKTNIPREQMIAEIIKNLFEILKNPHDKSFMEKYKSRSLVLGRDIYYYKDGEKRSATAISIDDSGGLVIRTAENKLITLTGGEITVRIK